MSVIIRFVRAFASLLTVALLLGLTVAQLLVLMKLPYSKASLQPLAMEAVTAPSDPLVLDGLSWHPQPFERASSLESVRVLTRQHCPGLAGFALATCLSNVFAQRFPNGGPRREFFDRQYDPTAVFMGHFAGEPGHCVTRSSMVAVALLATGTPARVVQILGRNGAVGHNVVEVWEPRAGWQLLDPSFAGLPESADGQTSAVALIQAPFRWRPVPFLQRVAGVNQDQALVNYAEQHLLGGNIVYPDPWLYTRVGSSQTNWPFNGRFVVVGPTSLRLGPGQALLRAGILATLAACLALAIVIVARRARERGRAPALQGITVPNVQSTS
jgi:hypothetical protein